MAFEAPDGSRSNEKMVALHCPSCGVGVHVGQPDCGYCGSGLLRKEGNGNFLIPNGAVKFEINEQTRLDDLKSLLKKIQQELKDESQYGYVIWKNVPAVIGKTTNVADAMEDWHRARTVLDREELGPKWKTALQDFHELQHDMMGMPIGSRVKITDQYTESFGHNRRLPQSEIASFFNKPDFTKMELVMSLYPGGDDAEQLIGCVTHLREFIPKALPA